MELPWGASKRVPAGLIGLGSALVALTLAEVIRFVWVRPPIFLSFVTGIATSLPFILLLVAGGVWLARTDVSDRYDTRIAGWTVAGLLFFGGFFGLISVLFYPVASGLQVATLRWGIAVGSGCGFLIGFWNARSVDREVTAERASVRAEANERQRELLDYLNAVLRHEVLNTANVIQGHADLLKERFDRGTTDYQYATVIERQADELTKITADVRLLLDATQDAADREATALSPMIRDELDKLEDRYEAVETEADLPDGVYVPVDELARRLFSNLLSNAVEHNDSARPRVSVELTATADVVTVRVADNGPGIPDEERERLFEATTGMGADHGLGLTIVKRLADRYGGSVELTETGPDGTVFTVSLPRATDPGGGADCAPPDDLRTPS